MRKSKASDSVQNRGAIATIPKFFIGSSPSLAVSIVSPDAPASGVMVSANSLRKRKSDFPVGDWILDSGAFTEISTHGRYRHSVDEYCEQIARWSQCGNLLIAVAQDYMCEPFILERTGLTIADHQRLTIERYDALVALRPPVPIMPVLQGFKVSDYLSHLQQYGDRLSVGAWVGVGSVCRRNGNPEEIADILRAIKLLRPDLRLHGFGLKLLALESAEVRQNLYSCDSMAWSFKRRFQPVPEPEIPMAHRYQEKVESAITGSRFNRATRTSGAGNGQGRKPSWKAGQTVAIRVPKVFASELLRLAREWDESP
jgi:hypothetical protein